MKTDQKDYKELYLNLAQRVSALHALADLVDIDTQLGRAMRKVAFGQNTSYLGKEIKAKRTE